MSYIKLTSLEDGPYDTINCHSDLEIPAIDFDPSSSYINLISEIQSTYAQSGAVNLPFLQGFDDSNLHPTSLIKNCNISSDKVGRLENMRRNNYLKQNLNDYMLSEADKLSQINSTYTAIGNYRDGQSVLCRQVERSGTAMSKAVESPIQVRLSDLFSIGGVKGYQGSKLGKTRIHLELQPEVVASIGELNINPDILEKLVVSPYVSNANVIQVNYPQDRPCPFYNGLEFSIKRSNNAVGNYVIVGISYNTTQKAYNLTLNTPIAPGNPNPSPFEKYLSSSSSSVFVINRVELVLKKYPQPIPNIPVLNYRTFTTEEVNGFPAGNYSKMFYLEPECVNLFVLFPTDDSNLTSTYVDKLTYRFRLDNEDLTNRDILVGSPLDLDRLNNTFNNADLNLKNLRGENNPVDIVGGNPRFLMMLATPVPPTQTEKLFQININSPKAIPRMILYKQVLRSVKVS